jgi:Cytochrome c/c1 heme lyase.
MPKMNQNPAPGQPFPLPKERQVSTIPKAKPDEEGPFWVYPSQQVCSFISIVSYYAK